MQWKFFFPSVMKGGSIPSCCIHHFFEFLEASLATCCAISAPFLSWRHIDNSVKPHNLSVFLGHCSLLFVRGARTSPHHSQVDPQPQPSRPCWGQTCVHKSACLWLAPMHSPSSSFKACTTPPIVGGKVMRSRCACTRPCYKAQMSALFIVLCTSTTRAT